MLKKLIYVTLLFALAGIATAEDFVTRETGENILFRQTDGQVVWTQTEGLGGTPTLILVGPDGNVYISTSNNQDCRKFDGKTGEYLGDNISNIGHRLYGICFGPDIDDDGIEDLYTFGGAAAVVNSYTSASGYTEQGSWEASVTGGAWVGDFGPDITGDGVQELYVLPDLAQNTGNILIVIDGATKTEHSQFPVPLVSRPGCLVAGSDGRIYITGRNNDVIASYLPDGTDPQAVVGIDGSNFSTQIAEGKAGEWYIANRFNVTGLPSDAGSLVISTDNLATTEILIAGTESADLYNGVASFDSADMKEGPAISPTPILGADDVVRDSILAWVPGPFAQSHTVYLSKEFADVNTASADALVAENQDVNYFEPPRMEFGTSYFWRVDEVNGAPDYTVFPGDIWSFEVEPYSIQIAGANIVTTASSFSNQDSTPEKTLDGSGLGEDGTHAIATETMWFTAMGDMDPWIQYEFDEVKKLDTMKVWNSNSSAEGFIGYGAKQVKLQYSMDGEAWEIFEDVNELSRASGAATYNQYDEINFGGVATKMVRLNIENNWGGFMQAYSLSEVQFSMIPVKVRTPVPASGAVDVSPNSVVTWRAGRDAAQHAIYLSTDPNAVTNGTASSVTTNTNSLDLGSFDLKLDETYYWRVDEVNDAEAKAVWEGPVWSFSTLTALVVDDFESYNNISPDRPFQAWLDGIGYSADEFFPAAYGGNGTGAAVGHDIWTAGSPHYNGLIMETASTLTGSSQSMPFYYSNSGNVASQIERMFAAPQDWTMGGAQTLSIAFRGQAGNTGTLYAKINNTKITYQRDAGNIAIGAWQAWNINLSSVTPNVQGITKLAIGVDGNVASGMVLIDDIKLYAQAGVVVTPVDPAGDGLVALYRMENTVNDSSGNAHNGAAVGTPVFVSGVEGMALEFNGDGSQYVDLGTYDPSADTGQLSVSLWAQWQGLTTFYQGLIGKRDTWSATDMMWQIEANQTNGTLSFARNGSNFADGDPVLPEGEWAHVGVAFDGSTARLFMNGSETGSGAFSFASDTESALVLGACQALGGNPFNGALDEIGLYNRALSASEMLYLAGMTAPVDKPF